jgi:hypothetical protein
LLLLLMMMLVFGKLHRNLVQTHLKGVGQRQQPPGGAQPAAAAAAAVQQSTGVAHPHQAKFHLKPDMLSGIIRF